jgi:alanyl-tRNA synthetase
VAFRLYDTFGFPLDLTQDVLRGRSQTVDVAGFEAAMAKQKAAAREAWAGSGDTGVTKLWFELRDELGGTDFLGYGTEKAEGVVTALARGGARVADAKEGMDLQIVVNQSPFYAESGGQVGDTGTMTTASGAVIHVADTQKEAGAVWVHHAHIEKGALKTGDVVVMRIPMEPWGPSLKPGRLKITMVITRLWDSPAY